jgi:hypothetical protein
VSVIASSNAIGRLFEHSEGFVVHDCACVRARDESVGRNERDALKMLGERFEVALVFAAAHHRTQVRKSTATPYISRFPAVASLAIGFGGTEDDVVAALLPPYLAISCPKPEVGATAGLERAGHRGKASPPA